MCKGYIILLMVYHKLQWRLGTRAIARSLPPAVGNLMVKFIVQVLPFPRIIRRALYVLQNINNTSDDGNDRITDNTNDDTDIDNNETMVDEQGEADANICLPLLSDTRRRLSVFDPSNDSPDNGGNDDDDDNGENVESITNADNNNNNNNNAAAITHDAVLALSDISRNALSSLSD